MYRMITKLETIVLAYYKPFSLFRIDEEWQWPLYKTCKVGKHTQLPLKMNSTISAAPLDRSYSLRCMGTSPTWHLTYLDTCCSLLMITLDPRVSTSLSRHLEYWCTFQCLKPWLKICFNDPFLLKYFALILGANIYICPMNYKWKKKKMGFYIRDHAHILPFWSIWEEKKPTRASSISDGLPRLLKKLLACWKTPARPL